MSNNFFLVRFTSEDDYATAAFGGPWKIYDYYIAVTQWSPSFNEEEPIKSILTWVRLPKLPIQYFNSLAVHRIGNYIEKTVKLDLATSEGARCRYARVCVEVDITKPLLGKYMIEDRVFKIEYESLENMCFECGCYGHKKELCSLRVTSSGEEGGEMESMEPGVPMEEQEIGEWMTVQRRNHKKASKSSPSSAQRKDSGSRFSPLQQAEPDRIVVPIQPTVATPTTVPITAPEEDVQLAKLKKVLDAALASQTSNDQSTSKGKAKQTKVSREPLRDMSNINVTVQMKEAPVAPGSSSGQVVENLESDEGLIPVTVVYQNPTFQTKLATPKPVKAKARAGPRSTTVSTKDPDAAAKLLGNKKRVFKRKDPIPGLAHSKADQDVTIGNHGVDTRKPPDRS
ncbi:hypothetical protein LINPERPRIM_LOCUS5573 [Linum perenne]